jgi:hypothetical protein
MTAIYSTDARSARDFDPGATHRLLSAGDSLKG